MRTEELLKLPNVREAALAEKLSGDRVRCRLCERGCIIPSGQRGFCKTRMNIGGRLYTLVYGDISSISANPIEKKPFFHLWPGSYALTVGTWGCNFTCEWCQNWDISKYPPEPTKANYISPEHFVKMVELEHCQGTSISFNEPTMLFEYSLDVFSLARKRGFYNTFVSNGYMTLKALKMLKDAGMDAIKFDLKGDSETVRRHCAADIDIVWRNIHEARTLGMHIELVTLVIPGVNDSDETIVGIAERCLREAGPDVPLHFTRFYPAYKMMDRPPTRISTLERARELALKHGIHYAYIGNVPGHKFENTYCHNCGELLIERYGFTVLKYAISKDKRCLKCGVQIPILGEYVRYRHR
jgi:pyruvate formate lyase activating enzyme